MKEEWKDIPEFKGYQVSNSGQVKSLQRVLMRSNNRPFTISEKILKQYKDGSGYLYVCLPNKGFKAGFKNIRVHRLVANAFIPNIYNKPQVNHKDGNKTNNLSLNLEWCDNSENQIHAYKLGLNHSNPLMGYSNNLSREIIMCDLSGNEIRRYGSVKEASRNMGVADSNIYAVAQGKRGHNTAGGYVWRYADEQS
jgi:hypothetical protein